MKTINGIQTHTGYWLRRLADEANNQLVETLIKEDVSWAEWAVLTTLYQGDLNSPAALADHIGIDRAAVTRVVERLVRRQFLEREKAEDRRRTILNLTEKARKKVPELAKAVAQSERELFSEVSNKDMEVFKKIIALVLKGRGIQPSAEWEA